MQFPSKRGFALLVTIVLLGFLVLLLVSLSALTRVETQVASNNQQVTQARQNALLGLNIALGQLQKYAGPDQRVTATSDLNAGATNPRYTGVWNVAAVNTAALANSPLSAASTTALPVPGTPDTWLVSGNDSSTPLAVTHNTASNTTDFETLVGNHTATAGDVRAKKVDVTASNVPGFAAATPATIGRYAYWVGDEGVKAKLNLTDPYTPRPAADAQNPAFTPTDVQSRHRLSLALRTGVEQMHTSAGAPIGAAFAPTANTPAAAALLRDLKRVISYQGSSFSGSLTTDTLKVRYHDLTTNSVGLLTNTATGGLKFDLTWELSKPRDWPNPQRLDGPLFLAKTIPEGDKGSLDWWPWGDYASATSEKSRMLNPRWSVLRDFYQMADRVSADGTIQMTQEISVNNYEDYSAVNSPVTPILVQMRIYLGAQETPTGVDARTYVMVLLANPYNARLAVPANSLRFGRYEIPQGKLVMNIRKGARTYGGNLEIMGQFARGFVCDEDLLFAPGEVKALTMRADVYDTTTAIPLREGIRVNAAFCTPRALDNPAQPNGDWNIRTAITADGNGWFSFWMSNGSGTVQEVRYIQYRVPAGSAGTFTGGGDQPLKIGGFFLTLKMPGEPGYLPDSSIRLFVDYNIRSQFLGRFKDDYPIAFHSYYNASPDTYSENLVPTAFWGLSTSDSFGRSSGETILFDIPRRPVGAPTSQPAVVSLGQLQHANISNTAYQPANAIGNSYASLYCQPERSVSVSRPVSFSAHNRKAPSWFYDMSYLLNESLWDGYYFSTVPQPAGTFDPAADFLPNTRHILSSRSGSLPTHAMLTADANAAATHLFVNGAFNVNSTSVEAWKALFSSLRGLSLNGDTNLSGPFFRTLGQTGGSTNAAAGLTDDSWTGFRNLTSAEIDRLAEKMVEQVRLRGPFRSLGDFVNRRLLTAAADPNGLRLRGALQAAIDAAGINDAFDSTGTPTKGNDTASAYIGNTVFTHATDPNKQWMIPANAVGNRATGAPGWLMQADLLQALGPVLTPRSDTFVIRAYGEAVNPATQETSGRAWCEAVVQRTVDYIDTSVATGNQPADALAALKPVNQTFGRRFKIVGFRWLTPNDI